MKPQARVNGHAPKSGNSKGAGGRGGKAKPQVDDERELTLDDEHAVDDDAAEEFETLEADDEAAIDDPVRMYLMQMGEIPMLNRESEVSAARQIETTRRRFRRTMMCSDYMLHAAVELLQKVADGTLRLDRTIEISVTNTT